MNGRSATPGIVTQPNAASISRDHDNRIRILEAVAARGSQPTSYTSLAGLLSIFVEGAVAPTIQGSSGYRLDTGLYGFEDPMIPCYSAIGSFKVVLDSAAGVGGNAWRVQGVIPNDGSWGWIAASGTIVGNGRLVRMGDNGVGGLQEPYVAYPVWLIVKSGAELWIVTSGIEMNPAQAPSPDPVGYVRDNWPWASLGKNDFFQCTFQVPYHEVGL